MAVTPKVLVEYQNIPNVATPIYTASQNAKGAYLDKVVSTNYSGSAVTVSIWLIPPAGVSSDANKVIASKSLASAESYTFPEIAGKYISPLSKVEIVCSAATAANIGISGREVT